MKIKLLLMLMLMIMLNAVKFYKLI